MLNMSFYDGTLDRDKLVQFITETDKPIVYTHGFAYPATYRVPATKTEAIFIVRIESILDATE